MPRKGTYARLYATGKPRGGSKRGSRPGLSKEALAHVQADYARKSAKGGNSKGSGGPRPRKTKKGAGRISVLAVARFLEFGTSKMAKKPFMVAGFKAAQGKAAEILIRGIKDALDKACRR
jgi:HK97 gp10 family phage protein